MLRFLLGLAPRFRFEFRQIRGPIKIQNEPQSSHQSKTTVNSIRENLRPLWFIFLQPQITQMNTDDELDKLLAIYS
jgi:hypothetical protein